MTSSSGSIIAHFGGRQVERISASEYKGQELRCFDR